ncbi:hypothetical protein NQ314_016364 [Rhamnusium bicolor]|uniref:Uncharacterized protein n=1 Tax=Rhamnusium bicolor TaxID=1586634 RepID=A0AAV8WXF4_9CUCU|nr:hypothetical protein NQ314_016364 [Rhamnusium bicolor]
MSDDSPVHFKGNTSIPSAENASEFEFTEDFDDSVKDANYVNDCDSETSETEDAVENRKENSKVHGMKRKLGPEKWKKNLAKKLRNIGEAHTNTKSKKTYPKRELQPPCDERLLNDLGSEVPRIPSHYCRSDTNREFIEGGLTVADLHRSYNKLKQEAQKAAGNYVLYHKIFNEEYISFFTPKKDQCEFCTIVPSSKKNKFLLSMYAYAVRNLQNIKRITHKYLITGHIQNEGDNAHSLIKRNVKKYLKSGPICVPKQYVTLIRTAKKTGSPYNVQELSHEDFYDLKHLANSTGFGNLPKSFKLSEVQIFKIEKNNPYTLSFKKTFDQEEFESIQIDKGRSSRGKGAGLSCLIKAYKNKVGITEDKRKSLLSLFNETVNNKGTALPKTII